MLPLDLRQLSVIRSADGFQASWKNDDGSHRTFFASDPTEALKGVLDMRPVIVMQTAAVALVVLESCCCVTVNGIEMGRGRYDDMLSLYRMLSP